MANRYWGDFGDIWKHAALGMLLAESDVEEYWETNSGSARYEPEAWVERTYGIDHFYPRRDELGTLGEAYRAVLERCGESGRLTIFPGSPYVAMCTAGTGVRYLFCDIDREALDNIGVARDELAADGTVETDRVELWEGDGGAKIAHEIDTLGAERGPARVFVMLDPYRPFESQVGQDGEAWATSARAVDPVTLFVRLATAGISTIFWYGYRSDDERTWCHRALGDAAGDLDVWCGEQTIVGIGEVCDFQLQGCGIAAANVGPGKLERLEAIGAKVADIWRDAAVDGQGAPLTFEVIDLKRVELDMVDLTALDLAKAERAGSEQAAAVLAER